ncbi:MAG: hypothetical protein R2794_02015 [Chitinophagales bacterium]
MDIHTLDLHWYDYLIFLVYNVMFTYVFYSIGQIRHLEKKVLRNIVLLYQVLFVLILVNLFYPFIPVRTESTYYAYMLNTSLYPQDAPNNLMAVYYIAIYTKIVCLNSPFIFIMMCNFFLACGLVIFLAGFQTFGKVSNRQIYIMSLLLLCYPALYIFHSDLGRIGFSIFAFAIFLRGNLAYRTGEKPLKMLLGAILISAINIRIAPFIFLLLVYTFLDKAGVRSLYRWMVTAVLLLLGAVVYGLITGIQSPEALAEERNMLLDNPTLLLFGNVQWQHWGQVLIDSIFIALQGIATPFPIFSNFPLGEHPVLLVDGIFYVACLILALWALMQNKKAFPGWQALITYLILVASGELSLMLAAENRIFILLCLLPLTAQQITRLGGEKPQEHAH